MDGPLKAVPRRRPWPRENLLQVHPTAAEVVGENKLLPGLVVLYSVFGLGAKSREEVKCEILCVNRWVIRVVYSICNISWKSRSAPFPRSRTRSRSYFAKWLSSEKKRSINSQIGCRRNFILLTRQNQVVNSMKVMYLYKEKHANSNSGAQCQA